MVEKLSLHYFCAILLYWRPMCFLHTCSAVTVTIGNPGDVIEGSETRMTCNIVRDDPSSLAIVTWTNTTNGASDTIAVFGLGMTPTLNAPYDARFEIDAQATLIIANTLRTDSGTYECEATVNGEMPPSDKADVTLNVIYNSGYLTLADSAVPVCIHNITCTGSITANPTPDINLYHDDNLIATQKTLPLFHLISSEQSDSGRYRCDANNSAATVTSNNVTLQFNKPTFKLLEIDNDNNLEVTVAVEQEDSGYDSVTYTYQWFKDGVLQSNDTGETFTFPVEIGKNYTVAVNVTNCSGTTTDSILIQVQGSCSGNPCQNSGTCIPHPANYTCIYTADDACHCENDSIGLSVGIGFVGFVVGISLVLLVQHVRIKIKPKKDDTTRIKCNKNPDTYMEYSPNNENENQTYQDLQRKEEEAYENIKPNSK